MQNVNACFLAPDTIAQLLESRARQFPKDKCYVFPELSQAYSWGRLWEEVRLLSARMHALGVQKGDRVALLMDGCMEQVATMFAAITIGAIAVPLNTYATVEELKVMLLAAQPVIFVMGNSAHQISPEAVQHARALPNHQITDTAWLPYHTYVHGYDAGATTTLFRFDGLAKPAEPCYLEGAMQQAATVTAKDPAFLLFTSGTTGSPKAVLRSPASFMALRRLPATWWRRCLQGAVARAGDHFTSRFAAVSLLPLYHMGGIGMLLTSLKVCNLQMVMLTRFHPVRAVEVISGSQARFLIGTPFMIQALLAANAPASAMLDRVLGIIFTSSAVDSRIINKTVAGLKNLSLFMVSYGSSEAGAVANGVCFLNNKRNARVSLLFKLMRSLKQLNGEVPAADFAANPYSIGGKVHKTVEVKIRDLQTGAFLPPGSHGEILIRSHRVMHYLSEAADQESFLPGGWFRSGDTGYLDARGFIIITGRIKRIISRGGEKISPVEIENILLQYPGIEAAFVAGIPDALYGEKVSAAVVVQEGSNVSIPHLKQWLCGRLSRFKVPEHIVFLDEFPVTASGKVAGAQIRQAIAAALNPRDVYA